MQPAWAIAICRTFLTIESIVVLCGMVVYWRRRHVTPIRQRQPAIMMAAAFTVWIGYLMPECVFAWAPETVRSAWPCFLQLFDSFFPVLTAMLLYLWRSMDLVWSFAITSYQFSHSLADAPIGSKRAATSQAAAAPAPIIAGGVAAGTDSGGDAKSEQPPGDGRRGTASGKPAAPLSIAVRTIIITPIASAATTATAMGAPVAATAAADSGIGLSNPPPRSLYTQLPPSPKSSSVSKGPTTAASAATTSPITAPAVAGSRSRAASAATGAAPHELAPVLPLPTGIATVWLRYRHWKQSRALVVVMVVDLVLWCAVCVVQAASTPHFLTESSYCSGIYVAMGSVDAMVAFHGVGFMLVAYSLRFASTDSFGLREELKITALLVLVPGPGLVLSQELTNPEFARDVFPAPWLVGPTIAATILGFAMWYPVWLSVRLQRSLARTSPPRAFSSMMSSPHPRVTSPSPLQVRAVPSSEPPSSVTVPARRSSSASLLSPPQAGSSAATLGIAHSAAAAVDVGGGGGGRNGPASLGALLASDSGVHAFRCYLVKEFSVENLVRHFLFVL